MSTDQRTLLHPLIVQLRQVAEARHLTQVQVADELGVSERAAQYWLTTDMVPQKRHLKVIAEWLARTTADQAA